MADTNMFFQLVSHLFRRSDSSLVSMGSTMGVARCLAMKPMGLACSVQARIRFFTSCLSESMLIEVMAFCEGLLEEKVMVALLESAGSLSSVKPIDRNSRVLAPAFTKSSIVLNGKYAAVSKPIADDPVTCETVICVLARVSTNSWNDVSSVKKSGFAEIQPISSCVTGSVYGIDQWSSCALDRLLASLRVRQLLYPPIKPIPIFTLIQKKNAAAATAA